MLGKSIKTASLAIAVLLLTTGCWDSVDIEDKDITTIVVVDKTVQGYSFTLEIASPKSGNAGGESGGSEEYTILKSEGSTYVEAREDLDRKADKPIYLGAVDSVILTDKLAYSGIEEYVYRLRETGEYRKMVGVVVTTACPEDLLNVKSEHNTGVGMAIEDTLKSLVNTGQSFHVSLGDILESLASPCKCFLLPCMAISDKEIALSGYSVFDCGTCIGFIPVKKSKGAIFLKAKYPKWDYVVPYENGSATVGISFRKKDIKPSYSDGKIRFDLDFYVDAKLRYTQNGKPVTDEMDRQIKVELQKMIYKELKDTVDASQQEYNCDYLDFFNVFRIAYPVAFRNMEWNQEYTKAEFAIQVKVDLETTGTLDYEPRIEH